ncbi:MAG: hypothetical protein MHM6MM_007247 [Cercozoa sp. M6MM]
MTRQRHIRPVTAAKIPDTRMRDVVECMTEWRPEDRCSIEEVIVRLEHILGIFGTSMHYAKDSHYFSRLLRRHVPDGDDAENAAVDVDAIAPPLISTAKSVDAATQTKKHKRRSSRNVAKSAAN